MNNNEKMEQIINMFGESGHIPSRGPYAKDFERNGISKAFLLEAKRKEQELKEKNQTMVV